MSFHCGGGKPCLSRSRLPHLRSFKLVPNMRASRCVTWHSSFPLGQQPPSGCSCSDACHAGQQRMLQQQTGQPVNEPTTLCCCYLQLPNPLITKFSTTDTFTTTRGFFVSAPIHCTSIARDGGDNSSSSSDRTSTPRVAEQSSTPVGWSGLLEISRCVLPGDDISSLGGLFSLLFFNFTGHSCVQQSRWRHDTSASAAAGPT